MLKAKGVKKSKFNKFNNHKLLIASALFASLFSLNYVFTYNKAEEKTILAAQTKKFVYPTLYSDKHITQNATESNPQFSNIAFVEKDNLLANVISTVKNNPGNLDGATESGTWLWTPVLDITPEYAEKIISESVKLGVKNIYLSIDSYLDIYIMPDVEEKRVKRKKFDETVNNFISLANKNGITVDAEAGWRNWAEDGNTYKALATINYANKYNKEHQNKFRSFQYDVEPYLLDNYKKDKEKVLKNYLNLIDQSVSFLNNSDLSLSVVIPEFYDGKYEETPEFVYKGKLGFTTEHLLSILDRRAGSKIIIMSYRNWSKGEDGSIDISRNEISSANKHKTKIVIAQETGEVEPSYITFHNTSKRYYRNQTKELASAFTGDKSFGGLATHYINAFIELK